MYNHWLRVVAHATEQGLAEGLHGHPVEPRRHIYIYIYTYIHVYSYVSLSMYLPLSLYIYIYICVCWFRTCIFT